MKDPEAREKKLSAELANGRLAMMAIIGMFFQSGLTGTAWGDWALYTDSPLRAFENAGDFSFKGLTSSDPAETQKKLAAEIASGRLAMMAIIGMLGSLCPLVPSSTTSTHAGFCEDFDPPVMGGLRACVRACVRPCLRRHCLTSRAGPFLQTLSRRAPPT